MKFCEALRNWYGSNDKLLRSRYLYRHSIEEPNIFSTDRFLCIFQALEGIVKPSGGAFLLDDDLAKVEAAMRSALPDHPKLDAIIRKIRSNNGESPRPLLKRELPKLFEHAHVLAKFNVEEFIDRIYKRRNKLSHGGSHLDATPFDDTLVADTILLTAIYVISEARQLGLNPQEALIMFQDSFGVQLPLEIKR